MCRAASRPVWLGTAHRAGCVNLDRHLSTLRSARWSLATLIVFACSGFADCVYWTGGWRPSLFGRFGCRQGFVLPRVRVGACHRIMPSPVLAGRQFPPGHVATRCFCAPRDAGQVGLFAKAGFLRTEATIIRFGDLWVCRQTWVCDCMGSQPSRGCFENKRPGRASAGDQPKRYDLPYPDRNRTCADVRIGPWHNARGHHSANTGAAGAGSAEYRQGREQEIERLQSATPTCIESDIYQHGLGDDRFARLLLGMGGQEQSGIAS